MGAPAASQAIAPARIAFAANGPAWYADLLRLYGVAFVLAGACAAAGPGDARAAAVRLADVLLSETTGAVRRDAPAQVAIPLPAGILAAEPAAVVALDRGGGRVLERWPDGSVRWLLADLPVSLAPRARERRTLSAPRGSARPASALGVERRGGAVLIRGKRLLPVTVPPQGTVLASLGPIGSGSVLDLAWPRVTIGTTGATALETATVDVEAQDPLRVEVLIRARPHAGLRHEARLQVVAGQPWIRLRHTVTNLSEAAYLPLADLALMLPWRSVRGEVVLDGRVVPATFAPPGRGHTLLQVDSSTATIDGEAAGRRGDGLARVSGAGVAWSVAMPWFWQEYPKRLGISETGLEMGLVAAADGPLPFGVGAAKTWEVWIGAHPEATAPPLPDAAAAAVAAPHAVADAAAVVASGALPYAIAPDTPGAAPFLAALRTAIDQYRARAMAERWDDGPPGDCKKRTGLHRHVGFHGVFNWGDWNFPGFRDETKGCDAWGNLEYDLAYVLGLAYLATGDPELRPPFEAAAVHFRDVDVIHHWPGHADRVGLNHPHKVRHFATDAPNTVDLGHVWLDGLLLHYRLTGEARSLQAVRRMADGLAALAGRAKNPRQFGWPMQALSSAYDATREDRYRTAALALAHRAAPMFPPDPNAEWKMGILAEGMMAVHRTTGDSVARGWLEEYGRRLLVPSERPRDPRLVVPAGYLAVLAGDPRLAALARDTAAALAPGNWGKPLASVGRIGFALLGPLAQAPPALTRDLAAPPPASPPEPQRSSPPRATPVPPSDR